MPLDTSGARSSPVPFSPRPGFRSSGITPALQFEVQQFYYWEAGLLDNRHYAEWFALLADDIHYFAPIRTTHTLRDRNLEVSDANSYAHFDDDHSTLKGRLRKFESDMGWAENPASRTRHLITNVVIEEMRGQSELFVRSAFLVYRNRLERQVDLFAGERQDLLRRVPSECGFQIARRTILIDQSTLLSNNLSILF